MQIESQWIFDASPESIWPHFFKAKMDHTRPFLFRLGVPKPISCCVLEGNPTLGNTRQCTTDRGTINQRIVELEANRRLSYRMLESTIWCREWVGHLKDTFTLMPRSDGKTEVRRITEFGAAGRFKALKELALMLALRQAHRYAARNWRRLAGEAELDRAGL
jgi:hypothetical protein